MGKLRPGEGRQNRVPSGDPQALRHLRLSLLRPAGRTRSQSRWGLDCLGPLPFRGRQATGRAGAMGAPGARGQADSELHLGGSPAVGIGAAAMEDL